MIRDWWRGYSDADFASMRAKLRSEEASKPDGVIVLTGREMKAMQSGRVGVPIELNIRHPA